ncbi:MAG TPA: hypothetical protein VF892_00605 [Pseudonocardiaceae bacterium]
MTIFEYLVQARHILPTDPAYAARNLNRRVARGRRRGAADITVSEILTLAYAGPK